MAKTLHLYRDPRLNSIESGECDLYLTVGSESLSGMVWRPGQGLLALGWWVYDAPCLEIDEAEPEIRRILAQEPLFSLPFARTSMAFAHAQLTFTPTRLFQSGREAEYFQLLLPGKPRMYQSRAIQAFDCYATYTTDQSVSALLQGYFPQGAETHIALPLAQQYSHLAKPEGNSVFVNLRHNLVQIAVFERQNLQLFNAYPFEHPNDLLYAVLLVYDQFRLNPAELPLRVSGYLLKQSEAYIQLARYFSQVLFVYVPFLDIPDAARKELPGYCFFDLFCLKGH